MGHIYKSKKELKKIIKRIIKQVLTAISPRIGTSINYRYVCGEWIDWKNPQDNINLKLNWLRVITYYNNKKVQNCIDKYKIREYLDIKGYSHICPRLYGVYNNADEIDWNELPEKFVVKCNHACGTNLIVKDKASLDTRVAVKLLKDWQKINYWKTGEVHYRFIEKKIIIEEYLGDGEQLKTVKFFCFNGEPKVAYISLEEDRYIDYYDMDFNHLNYSLKGHSHYPKKLEKPDTFDEMARIARNLSSEFPFVRVDLYDSRRRNKSKGKIYISELTFVPTGGYMKITPPEVLNEWGKWLKLPM